MTEQTDLPEPTEREDTYRRWDGPEDYAWIVTADSGTGQVELLLTAVQAFYGPVVDDPRALALALLAADAHARNADPDSA